MHQLFPFWWQCCLYRPCSINIEISLGSNTYKKQKLHFFFQTIPRSSGVKSLKINSEATQINVCRYLAVLWMIESLFFFVFAAEMLLVGQWQRFGPDLRTSCTNATVTHVSHCLKVNYSHPWLSQNPVSPRVSWHELREAGQWST